MRILLCTATFAIALTLLYHEHVVEAINNLRIDNSSPDLSTTSHTTQPLPFTYLRNYEFQDMTSGGDEAWANLTPSKGGFLWVQYNETLNIQYGISMFHGLHCLQMLRTSFKAQPGLSSANTASSHSHPTRRNRARAEIQGETTLEIHLGNCLVYIAMVSLQQPYSILPLYHPLPHQAARS